MTCLYNFHLEYRPKLLKLETILLELEIHSLFITMVFFRFSNVVILYLFIINYMSFLKCLINYENNFSFIYNKTMISYLLSFAYQTHNRIDIYHVYIIYCLYLAPYYIMSLSYHDQLLKCKTYFFNTKLLFFIWLTNALKTFINIIIKLTKVIGDWTHLMWLERVRCMDTSCWR